MGLWSWSTWQRGRQSLPGEVKRRQPMTTLASLPDRNASQKLTGFLDLVERAVLHDPLGPLTASRPVLLAQPRSSYC